jgi:hypothetical protein
MNGKRRKNKETGLMTGGGRGPGEVKKGPEWIAMERREEKERKISYSENVQKEVRKWKKVLGLGSGVASTVKLRMVGPTLLSGRGDKSVAPTSLSIRHLKVDATLEFEVKGGREDGFWFLVSGFWLWVFEPQTPNLLGVVHAVERSRSHG